jgi:hypothetical protein
MNVIKIKPESIQANSNAGRTETHIPGPISSTFEFEEGHQFPEDFIEEVDYIKTGMRIESGSKTIFEARLVNPNKILAIKNLPWEASRDVRVFMHLPEPKYLFEYDKETLITCPDCGHIAPFNTYPESWDIRYLCCNECLSEMEVEIQSIEDAIAEHHLSI